MINEDAISTSTTIIIRVTVVVVRRLGDQCAHANRLKLVARRHVVAAAAGGCDVMAPRPAAFSK